MKRLMSIEIKGREHSWSFPFKGDEAHIPDWEDDGLTVHVIENTIPVWAQRLGLTRPWCWVQDRWQWVRLW